MACDQSKYVRTYVCEKIDDFVRMLLLARFVISNRLRVGAAYLPGLMDAWYSVCKNFNKRTLSDDMSNRNKQNGDTFDSGARIRPLRNR